jgi:cold shock CspA family protein
MNMSSELHIGRVRFFDSHGWGYITPAGSDKDLWFHCTELPGKRGERTIADGTPVTFRVLIGDRLGRDKAVEVRPFKLADDSGDA